MISPACKAISKSHLTESIERSHSLRSLWGWLYSPDPLRPRLTDLNRVIVRNEATNGHSIALACPDSLIVAKLVFTSSIVSVYTIRIPVMSFPAKRYKVTRERNAAFLRQLVNVICDIFPANFSIGIFKHVANVDDTVCGLSSSSIAGKVSSNLIIVMEEQIPHLLFSILAEGL